MGKLVEKDANRIIEEDDVVPPPMYTGDRPQVVTADTARQAPLGRPVIWVLIVGLVLVCAAFLAVWLFTGAPAAH